jgi:hypothetical protein
MVRVVFPYAIDLQHYLLYIIGNIYLANICIYYCRKHAEIEAMSLVDCFGVWNSHKSVHTLMALTLLRSPDMSETITRCIIGNCSYAVWCHLLTGHLNR